MNEFYQSTICHVCKQFTSSLKRCSRCKLYAYCSKKHQKIHWSNHKLFCDMVHSLLVKDGKARCHVLDLPGIANITNDEWKQIRTDLKLLWEHLLRRKLTSGEDQLWMFPRVCETCRTPKQDILIDCPICFSVSYCCVEHQTTHFNIHKKFCQSLKLCYEINLYLFNNKTFIKPLPKICADYKILPENTDIFVEKCTTSTEVSDFTKYLTADIVSPFLTIIYTLQTCNLIINRQYYKNSLVIHLVGASVYELSLPLTVICQFFFHWITNISNITLILIGPEINTTNNIKEQLDSESGSKTYTLLFERCFYHDYVNSTSSTHADLIVAFNCGLHEFEQENVSECDTWAKSVGLLTNAGNSVPLLLTAYTVDEAKRDLQRLESVGNKLEVILRAMNNPFRGSKPIRDWATSDSPIFYQNNYITIVKSC